MTIVDICTIIYYIVCIYTEKEDVIMKFCQHCGKEVLDEALICPGCGCSVQTINNTKVIGGDESVSVGLVVLSVLIPLFGIIYWPVQAKARPKCARTCGIAAIISWGVSFVLSMVVYMASMLF